MNIRAIKTAESEYAVNKIKSFTNKNFNLGVSLKTPEEFIEKRNYMQSDEFLKDEHNVKMFNIIDDLIYVRDKIGREITKHNEQAKEKLVQAINGFKRTEKSIKENPSVNFEEIADFNSSSDIEYRLLRNIILYNESRNI